jgi:hypothetical protein
VQHLPTLLRAHGRVVRLRLVEPGSIKQNSGGRPLIEAPQPSGEVAEAWQEPNGRIVLRYWGTSIRFMIDSEVFDVDAGDESDWDWCCRLVSGWAMALQQELRLVEHRSQGRNLKASLTLHASAVCRNGRALAFVGPSGAGKSTLAASMAAVGATLLSDDSLFLTQESGSVSAFPGWGNLRLRAGAVEMHQLARHHRVTGVQDSRTLVEPLVRSHTFDPDGAEGPFALSAIVLPSVSPDHHGPAQLQRISGAEAFLEVTANLRVEGRVDSDLQAAAFEACVDMVGILPVVLMTIAEGPVTSDVLHELASTFL